MKTIEKANVTAVNAEYLDDIIFEGRNQSYGAYDLRKNYNSNLNLSLIIVLSFAAAILSLAFIYSMKDQPKPKVETAGSVIEIDLSGITDFVAPEIPEQKAKTETTTTVTNNNGTPVVVDNVEETEEQPATVEEINETTGSVTVPTTVPVIDPPVTAQTDPVDRIFDPTGVTTQALFKKGSVEEFRKWLSRNINYPEDAVSANVNGKVYLQFTIDKMGKLTDIKVLKGIHPVIDQAAIRALNSSPKWTAATFNGQAVKVSYIIPITFCIQK